MTDHEILIGNLRQLHSWMQFRLEAIEERDREDAVTGRGVGISYLLVDDIAQALAKAAEMLEAAPREQAALIADKIADNPPAAPEGRHDDWCRGWQDGAMEVAAAIREKIR